MEKLKMLLALSLIISACESKFEEGKTSGEKVDAETKKEYKLKAEKINDRLAKAQDVIVGLNAVLNKIKSQEFGKISLSNLVVEILESVKASQVLSAATGYESYGEIYLTTPGISPECRLIRTRSVYAEDKGKANHSIFVSTCKTKDSYQKIAELTLNKAFAGEDPERAPVSIVVDTELQTVLPEVDAQQFLQAQNCSVIKTENRISELYCEASAISLGKDDKLQFHEISYVELRNPILRATGILSSKGEPKADLVIEVDKNGKTFVKTTPIGIPTK